MFERRLKILLGVLFTITAVLVLRAAQVQIVRRSHWDEQAADALKREQLIETTRGRLLDCNGVPIAEDVACIDACVDYRAIVDPPDDRWVSAIARQWARQRRSDEWRASDAAGRRRMIEEEKSHVVERIQIMWATLARLGEKSPDQIEDIRQDIARRVEMQRRYVWYRKFEVARYNYQEQRGEQQDSNGFFSKWLADETGDVPRLDDFEVKVAEQTGSHAILKAISPELQNTLGKSIDDFPGLELRPGMTRSYPACEVAAHLVGHLSAVRREDLERDAQAGDELRKYQYTDLIGRSGLEALCEPLLRGKRGRIERYYGMSEGEPRVTTTPAEPGQDVYTTIDIELQREVQRLFETAQIELRAANSREGISAERRPIDAHGGAVLIDLRSGEVRALVSNPTFDANAYESLYAKMARDDIDHPLMNRATQFALETGSTIKPVVGLGAITQGILGVNDGVECTGYLVVNGHKQHYFGKCWVATRFEHMIADVAHHPVPFPHRGHDGNADGFLTFSDALERSCNIYFETAAHRLGIELLSNWMEQFGLGRPTGIGIEEVRGRVPRGHEGPNPEYTRYTAGIGQGPVLATPLQMANVAATIARDGVWMRPTLLTSDRTAALRAIAQQRKTPPATQPGTQPAGFSWWQIPDRVDLHLSPAGLAAAHEGMFRVVNGDAGTGTHLASKSIAIAGKTGTAQAAKLTHRLFDADGNLLRDENGKIRHEIVEPSTVDWINPIAPWCTAFDSEGKRLNHSWVIGYAPANNPQVAFAVMVEYGGSGGGVASNIAKGMLDAAMRHGYLSADRGMTTRVDPDAR